MTKRQGFLIWMGASAGFMLIGAFGPWIKVLTQSVSGTDGSNDGWLVVAAAGLGMLLAFLARASRTAGIWAVLGGVGGATTTIYDRNNISSKIHEGGAFAQVLASVGWGLNLAMIASISFVIAGAAWLLTLADEGAAEGAPSASTINVQEQVKTTQAVAPQPSAQPGEEPVAEAGDELYRRDPETGEFIRVDVPRQPGMP